MRIHFFVMICLFGCDKTSTTSMPDMIDARLARGAYLVENVAHCADCHTPKNADRSLDRTRWLGGVADAFDLDPSDATVGLLPTPNLTPHATGLAAWSDAQIKAAITDGVNKDGAPLFFVMPYSVFHNMKAEDVDAIVVYLRSVKPVDNAVPSPQPLPLTLTQPARAVDDAVIPHTTLASSDAKYAQAERGRYLATIACIDCHTAIGLGRVPLDTSKLFAGNRIFDAAADKLPVPPYPPAIYSSNLTPHANGIGGWAPEDVAKTIKMGVDKVGAKLCPPMPFGPAGSFGGMTDEDALAIGVYLTTIPPIDSGGIPFCTAP